MFNDEVGLIEFGLGGHTEHLVPVNGGSWGGTCSGYQSPESFWGHVEKRDGLRHVIPDGTPVLDRCDVLRKHPEYAFNSPMVGVALDHVERCPEPDPLMAMGFGGAFKAFALKRIADKEWSGLDTIPLASYLHWWVKRGARVGFTSGRSFVWLDDAKLGVRPKLVQPILF